MSMKKSGDTIGSRTRDLPVCSAVPQPLRHRVPHLFVVSLESISFTPFPELTNGFRRKAQSHNIYLLLTYLWQGCQPYSPAAFTPQEIFLVLISVSG
jgi:hypothetical protein